MNPAKVTIAGLTLEAEHCSGDPVVRAVAKQAHEAQLRLLMDGEVKLTSGDKAAFAIAAGVPYTTREENGKLILTTARPVDVVWNGREILVAIGRTPSE